MGSQHSKDMEAMENEAALKAANDEIMRKIGRNMLLFQQLEGLLKYLLANGSFSGTASNLEANRRSRIESIKRRSMGQLVGEFIDTSYSENTNATVQEQTEGLHISFSFQVECKADHYYSKKRALTQIVAERNNLIHHFLPTYNPESHESCQTIDRQLEQQREKLLPELRYLRELARAMDKAINLHIQIIDSKYGHRFLVEGVLPSEGKLDALLRNIVSIAARPDGWTPLATAGQLIHTQFRQEMDKICEERGIKKLTNLKKLIKASPVFELMEEPNKGGTQWLFRIKEYISEEFIIKSKPSK